MGSKVFFRPDEAAALIQAGKAVLIEIRAAATI